MLNTQQYKVWSNPGKGVAPSPTPQCSSYWKGSLLVANFTYFTINSMLLEMIFLKNTKISYEIKQIQNKKYITFNFFFFFFFLNNYFPLPKSQVNVLQRNITMVGGWNKEIKPPYAYLPFPFTQVYLRTLPPFFPISSPWPFKKKLESHLGTLFIV